MDIKIKIGVKANKFVFTPYFLRLKFVIVLINMMSSKLLKDMNGL